MSCHIMSCHIIPCHIMSYHVKSYHVKSYHIMSNHIISCQIISCHVMSGSSINFWYDIWVKLYLQYAILNTLKSFVCICYTSRSQKGHKYHFYPLYWVSSIFYQGIWCNQLVQFSTVQFSSVLYCTALYYTALYCIVLHCTALYCTALYCSILFCSVLFCSIHDFTWYWEDEVCSRCCLNTIVHFILLNIISFRGALAVAWCISAVCRVV